ncbi:MULTISPECIES: ComEC/Rec2 family competence protein [Sphingobacterium]|uniref:ComEC/Rec2 family competence protein n=1 Tax=Sphingobacterium tenebrionis TaxID=3111775 RepID=A0ABU8I529_9SPHI|nr:ComEC/Rec2 family competence protein [Sphingobacterium sp. CZ-2]QBR12045.1 ComEC family competence protein [Sphingobacterium sp. CZ-2]
MELEKIVLGKYIFVFLFFFLVLGYVIAQYITWSSPLVLILWIAGALVLMIYHNRIIQNHYKANAWIIALLLTIFSLLNMHQHLPATRLKMGKDQQVLAKLISEPKITKRQIRMEIMILEIQGQSIKPSKTLAVLWKDSLSSFPFHLGDQISFKAHLKSIKPAYNPHQFDYKSYLKSKGIYFQSEGKAEEVKLIKRYSGWNFSYWARKQQKHFADKFNTLMKAKEAFQIASAIVFGYRTDFSEEITQTFANTGTIHILSVSGYHVMLVFWFLNIILKKFDTYLGGPACRYILVLIIIWLYAAICGFAPPIQRAALMISIFIIGQWLHRFQFSVNSLAASAFILLCFDPHMLFDIGFQLSYLAVLGLILFTPFFKSLMNHDKSIFKKMISLLAVSLSAQLITTPLALYYFHQFPTYFLPANVLFTLPSSMMVIVGGILMISPFQGINTYFAIILENIITYSYSMLTWMDNLPGSSIKGLQMDGYALVISYSILLLLSVAYYFRHIKSLFLCLLMSCLLVGWGVWKTFSKQHFNGIRLYNVQKEIAFAIINNGHVSLFSSMDSIQDKRLKYAVWPDLEKFKALNEIQFVRLENWMEGSISFQGELCLIRNNKLPKQLNATETWIFDASNTERFIQESIALLDAKKQPYYILKDNFAYVWENKAHGKD